MRLIDADALWMDIIHSMDYCDDILQIIEKQPTIEPEPQWISCSKKLPEEDRTRTLTTISTPHNGAKVRSGHYSRGAFFNDNGDCWEATDQEVLAWMPLPEPYAERRESE